MITTLMLEKRTSESIFYDIDCTALLDATETITSITGVTADANSGSALTFAAPTVNTQAITFQDGTIGAIGKVIIVQISGGSIPSGQANNQYTVRALFLTSEGNTREATCFMDVSNKPMSTQY